MQMLKTSLFCTFFVLFTGKASAAQIWSAKLDSSGRFLVLDVSVYGGCEPHYFSLELKDGCRESFPVSCTFKLIDRSFDVCKAIVPRSAVIDLHKNGIYTDPYYSQGTLILQGDADLQGDQTEVVIRLPEILKFNQALSKCTKDINQYGNPSNCSCMDLRGSYDPVSGECKVD